MPYSMVVARALSLPKAVGVAILLWAEGSGINVLHNVNTCAHLLVLVIVRVRTYSAVQDTK